MRIVRAGAGLSIPKGKYTARRAAAAVEKVMKDDSYRIRAEQLARRVAQEDGVGAACRAILAAASG
jgi:UDP:flavonoid glycosyltransferase YjiC (YdhE family)